MSFGSELMQRHQNEKIRIATCCHFAGSASPHVDLLEFGCPGGRRLSTPMKFEDWDVRLLQEIFSGETVQALGTDFSWERRKPGWLVPWPHLGKVGTGGSREDPTWQLIGSLTCDKGVIYVPFYPPNGSEIFLPLKWLSNVWAPSSLQQLSCGLYGLGRSRKFYP